MPNSAATATSAEEYLSCWRRTLEQRLRTAVGKALAEQPKDPCAAVALELLRGTSLEERAAALSAAQAEQEDGPQDDFAGDAQVGCTASKNNETELRKLRDENKLLKEEIQSLNNQSLKEKNQSLKQDEKPSLKDQLSNEWGVAGWVDSLALAKVVAEALKEPPGTTDPFKYVLSLSLADLQEKLEAVKLSEAIAETLWSAIEKLRDQRAATGAALNAKFAAEGDTFEMGFGGVEQFYGGVLHASLEKIIGPPLMVEGSLLKAMETEHCTLKDADEPFDTSNGIEGATSKLEWEFVVAPVIEDQDSPYAERGGDFRTAHREWCRKPEPLLVYEKKMADEMNPRLVEAGQAPLIKEELVAGRLYTGPMYEKYNAVLRFNSARDRDGAVLLEYASMEEVPFLQKKCGWLHLGEWAATAAGKGEPAAVRWTWHNQYSTTIHAINSIIVKLSPLTRITPLYRGWAGATLPEAFFKPDAFGFRGGVEYGFSSTTTDRAQAVHYAEGKASTVLELVMGMIDRGADVSWLSQYPHEKETLLPPLMGLQGSTLVVQCSFSINMASLTLEQVAGKRKKLLTDMGAQMAAEVRRGVAGGAAEEAAQLVRAHLGLERCADAGGAADKRLEAPLGDEAEAYNSDPRFQAAVGDALKVKRAAVLAATMQHGGGGGLAAAMDTVLPLQASSVDLTGFPLGTTGWITASEVEGESKEVGAKVVYQGREMVVGVTRDSEDGWDSEDEEDDGNLKLVDDEMVGTVVAWMKSEPSALTSLKLDWGKACGRVREAVLGVVRTTRSLVALSVGEDGAMPLNPLQLNGREAVTSLDLSSKKLGPGSAAVVAAGLSVNGVLTNLNLYGNEIGDEGATAIAEALRGNEVLTTLVLCYNDIGPTGATAIAEALQGNAVMTNLVLMGNHIGDEGAAALASALRVNGVLTSLDVSYNFLTQEAALGIVRVERQRNKLTSLGLSRCSIGLTGAAEIAEYVSGSGVLKNIDLRLNSLGAEGKGVIRDAVSGREGFRLKMD
ncbi:hypothetical protein EMIHUDRAFT_230507 [Emiliania huxleyi CCMP1516]|uniref:Mono(ADP-ribosyl)transferase n=2 Tax=Emiliania huxleyi TaxID=2903 RepID=A0A0D3KAD1_EMIH1|nr:hypothetical protein EMIHUDRAFT_230507 [Emiliania huxleyi CCMP1516]EOD32716.1 hypothetical protein EMIHUDRAFT_230507 [Emiliania huxleyi CCMP1516]|eukprot:XP_005785145.1 hypothetical protein EMIHUDRAFT_230507 [Emiliania huxleyi CCMP1516]